VKLINYQEVKTIPTSPRGRYAEEVQATISGLRNVPRDRLFRGVVVAEFPFADHGTEEAPKEAHAFRQSLKKQAPGFVTGIRTQGERTSVWMKLTDPTAAQQIIA
jgi:hypothetical protein